MAKYGRIYIIRNTINSKVYIGQTKVSLKLRFQNHLSAARNGKDYVIGKAIRKYGEENFYIELLEECTIEELNERERYWISYYDSYNQGYNRTVGGSVLREEEHPRAILTREDVWNIREEYNKGTKRSIAF